MFISLNMLLKVSGASKTREKVYIAILRPTGLNVILRELTFTFNEPGVSRLLKSHPCCSFPTRSGEFLGYWVTVL